LTIQKFYIYEITQQDYFYYPEKYKIWYSKNIVAIKRVFYFSKLLTSKYFSFH